MIWSGQRVGGSMGVAQYEQTPPNDRPLYSLADVARYLAIPLTTLKDWVKGRTYVTAKGKTVSAPVIKSPVGGLSFNNLIELHTLRALRTVHEVNLSGVRTAIAYAQERLGIQRLLLSREILTGGGDLFIERYGELISLNRAGQLALKEVLRDYLQRVEWNEQGVPVRFYPFTSEGNGSKKAVVIDPQVSFGKPTVQGVKTSVIVLRIDAGESIEELAEDYRISPDAIREALVYETRIAGIAA